MSPRNFSRYLMKYRTKTPEQLIKPEDEKPEEKKSAWYYFSIFLTVLLVFALAAIFVMMKKGDKQDAVIESNKQLFAKYMNDKEREATKLHRSADSVMQRYEKMLLQERRWRDTQEVYHNKQLQIRQERHEKDSLINLAPPSEHFKFFSEYARKSGFGAEFNALNP